MERMELNNINDPVMLLTMAKAEAMWLLDGIGFSPRADAKLNDQINFDRAYDRFASGKSRHYFQRALEMVSPDDPLWLWVAGDMLSYAYNYMGGRRSATFRQISSSLAPHSLFQEYYKAFTLKGYLSAQRSVKSTGTQILQGGLLRRIKPQPSIA